MDLMDYLGTHRIYLIYYERRQGIKESEVYDKNQKIVRGREVYGDRQVHVQGLETNRLPTKVSTRAKPLKKEKDIPRWYYSPNTSIEMILTVFQQAGYEQVDARSGKDRLGEDLTVHYVAKKR